jgi:hypothetical protein
MKYGLKDKRKNHFYNFFIRCFRAIVMAAFVEILNCSVNTSLETVSLASFFKNVHRKQYKSQGYLRVVNYTRYICFRY